MTAKTERTMKKMQVVRDGACPSLDNGAGKDAVVIDVVVAVVA